MPNQWITKDVSLAYWLGEICILRKSFVLKVMSVDFLQTKTEDPSFISPYHKEADEKIDGFMLHSMPLAEERKSFWIEDGYIKYITKLYNRYYINLEIEHDEYWTGFSSKSRSTLRRKIRKFEKLSNGKIEWKTYTTPEEMIDFHRLARDISKETYQEKLLNVGLPAESDFYDSMLIRAEQGNVRGYLLFLNGQAISYLYTPITNGRYSYQYLGYHPEFSKFSPGLVLQMKVLEQLFQDTDSKTFDFTEGQSSQKKLLSTDHIHCGNLICLKFSIMNYFWLQLHRLTNILSSTLGSLLEKFGLKAKIKKLLRR